VSRKGWLNRLALALSTPFLICTKLSVQSQGMDPPVKKKLTGCALYRIILTHSILS
jgi:hypothetical protein